MSSQLSCDDTHQIDGLVRDCSISSAIAMEMLQSYTKPSKYECDILQANKHCVNQFENLRIKWMEENG